MLAFTGLPLEAGAQEYGVWAGRMGREVSATTESYAIEANVYKINIVTRGCSIFSSLGHVVVFARDVGRNSRCWRSRSNSLARSR